MHHTTLEYISEEANQPHQDLNFKKQKLISKVTCSENIFELFAFNFQLIKLLCQRYLLLKKNNQDFLLTLQKKKHALSSNFNLDYFKV